MPIKFGIKFTVCFHVYSHFETIVVHVGNQLSTNPSTSGQSIPCDNIFMRRDHSLANSSEFTLLNMSTLMDMAHHLYLNHCHYRYHYHHFSSEDE